MSSSVSDRPDQTGQPDDAQPEPMRPAKRPVSSGLLSVLGVIWGLLLVALAVICIRDALVGFGALSGKAWIATATNTLDGTTSGRWMYAVGAVCVVVGLLLLGLAIKPRRRQGIEVEATTSVLVSRWAVRRLATAEARDMDGVDTASASASRKRVTVEATILASSQAESLKSDIAEAVTRRLSALRTVPRVGVRVTSIGDDQ